ncbi:hypothetical protein DPMN_059949 [Dreissena polymorpha]|uniref:Uncharacterized protein n=1 Tax=Dreissena polymorpha TaxID=45954 RepID=A0A9D4HH20_DREPO|nr:hypothetical protein DPMN_059949 [Dreissena polymorpha]
MHVWSAQLYLKVNIPFLSETIIFRYYYKSIYSLGKRPPEPPLPVRAQNTPRVSCDAYENGSCRWYDEWNFEHLIEYER